MTPSFSGEIANKGQNLVDPAEVVHRLPFITRR
jgi:hypothetical protein